MAETNTSLPLENCSNGMYKASLVDSFEAKLHTGSYVMTMRLADGVPATQLLLLVNKFVPLVLELQYYANRRTIGMVNFRIECQNA